MQFHRLSLALTSATLFLALSGCSGVAAGAHQAVPAQPANGAADHGGDVSDAAAELGDLGPDDGYIAAGERVALSDDVPAVANLDPALREALQASADAAAAAGRDAQFTLVDGWRSARYQQYLFDQAVAEYGSADQAAKWVKSPTESKHVQGEAVDLATADAMDWLNRFGGEFGLCQIYANEPWHFELAADASGTCPPQLEDGSAG